VYVATSRGIVLWRYDQQGFAEHLIEKDPEYIGMLLRRFRELCATPSSPLSLVRESARQLYDILVGPVANELPGGQTLIIETDGLLSAVPFQALLDPAEHYLSDQHPIAYSPSLRYQYGLKSRVRAPFATLHALLVGSGIAEVGAGLRPLPDAIAEVHDVAGWFPSARLLVGEQASLSNLERELSRANVFHFAGHTKLSSGRLGLVLHDRGAHESSVLDPDGLEKMPLGRLELVFLSACSTEKDSEESGSGTEGLAYPFLAVGVPHVLASRWNIDSAAAKLLVDNFYATLLSGRSVASSLALAQARVRDTQPHPYYWAAFDAFGEP
jgi:CHAT domain-containing protein